MIIFTFLGKVLVGLSYHYINILSSILYSIIMVNSGGSRGGASQGACPPLYFCIKVRPEGPKKIFLRPAPPLSQSLDDRPPPCYLKVWICHWLQNLTEVIIIFIRKSYQLVNLRTSQRRFLLDEDLSDEAEFTVDVDEAEYNEADDADLHLNKLDKREIFQCNTINSLPYRHSSFGLSHNRHVTKPYCLRSGTTPLRVLKNL